MGSGTVVALLSLANTVLWAANSVSFWLLGKRMRGFPLFIGWFTSLPYLLLLPLAAWRARRSAQLATWKTAESAAGTTPGAGINDEGDGDGDGDDGGDGDSGPDEDAGSQRAVAVSLGPGQAASVAATVGAGAADAGSDACDLDSPTGALLEASDDGQARRRAGRQKAAPEAEAGVQPASQHASLAPRAASWRTQHACYLGYALLLVLDTTLEFLANPHMGGVVQAIVTTALPLPLCGLLARRVMKHSFGKWELAGSALVLVGSAFEVAQGGSAELDSLWWLLVFCLGLMSGVVYTVLWQWSFVVYGVDPLAMLAWGVFYSLPVFVACSYLYTINGLVDDGADSSSASASSGGGASGGGHPAAAVWPHQWDGVACVFGVRDDDTGELPPGCEEGAGLWLFVYAASSLLVDVVQVFFTAEDSAFFVIIADAVATPFTALTFSIPLIVGEDATEFAWYSGVALAITVLGMLVYKADEIAAAWATRKGRGSAGEHHVLLPDAAPRSSGGAPAPPADRA